MNKKSIIKILKAIVISFILFMAGFCGSTFILIKRTFDVTNTMIHTDKEAIKHVSIFGFKALSFIGVLKKGEYEVEVVKSCLHDYIPFIMGAMSLLIVGAILLLINYYKNIKANRFSL